MSTRIGSAPPAEGATEYTRKWSRAGRSEAQRRAALRRRARHLMRGAGMTDEDIAVVIQSTPEGVRKSFYRDALRGSSEALRRVDADSLEWED